MLPPVGMSAAPSSSTSSSVEFPALCPQFQLVFLPNYFFKDSMTPLCALGFWALLGFVVVLFIG